MQPGFMASYLAQLGAQHPIRRRGIRALVVRGAGGADALSALASLSAAPAAAIASLESVAVVVGRVADADDFAVHLKQRLAAAFRHISQLSVASRDPHARLPLPLASWHPPSQRFLMPRLVRLDVSSSCASVSDCHALRRAAPRLVHLSVYTLGHSDIAGWRSFVDEWDFRSRGDGDLRPAAADGGGLLPGLRCLAVRDTACATVADVMAVWRVFPTMWSLRHGERELLPVPAAAALVAAAGTGASA
jgi:hypothetical protein